MAGRKRKPTHLHVIQGTAQPCRMNKLEPTPSTEMPTAAIEIGPRASFWYGTVVERLRGIGLASSTHSEEIMLLASRLAEIEECEQDISVNGRVLHIKQTMTYLGRVIYDKDGNAVESVKVIANPSVGERSDAMRHAQSLLAEFGLSPASSPKVSKMKESRPENHWQALK